jgi:uncharacterized protein YdeI (YjbR/CyaY-like superfamily)
MATKAPPSDLPIVTFSTASKLEAHLERVHTTAPGFHLKLAKKNSGIASVSAAEAVEIALCFGWIDGRANAVDDDWWMVRYTPRRVKSLWSKKNVNTVAKLEEQGRMRPAGLSAVQCAKDNGCWERAYAGPATIEVPKDFQTAIADNAAASAFFEGINRSDRYSVLWRVETASPSSRAKRIEAIIQLLSVGKIPGAESKSSQKQKTASVKKVAKQSVVPRKRQGKNPKLAEHTPVEESHQTLQPRREGLRRRP